MDDPAERSDSVLKYSTCGREGLGLRVIRDTLVCLVSLRLRHFTLDHCLHCTLLKLELVQASKVSNMTEIFLIGVLNINSNKTLYCK